MALEGSPTHYELRVISGLPKGSACSIFNGYEIKRADPTIIEVDVTHHEVVDSYVDCTDDYPTIEISISLGSDFESGGGVLSNSKFRYYRDVCGPLVSNRIKPRGIGD